MFGAKKQRIEMLEQLAAARAARITELEDEARGLRYSSRHHAAKVTDLTADNARLTRQVTRLQAAYDNAVGLDSPAIDAGALWQERRTDKRKEHAA